MRKLLILLFALLPLFYASSEVAKNQLTTMLVKIFPEIRKGYIDLNQNGKLDTDTEINEIIPETSVKDSILQAKEILDFIILNYTYIPLDKLISVRKALTQTQQAIPELIALNYKSRIDTIVKKKRELEANGLYLTPSALKAALAKEDKYITTMVLAYKKEGNNLEKGFADARDSLFAMIEQGYPLPPSLGEEEKDILVSIMINTIIKEGTQKPAKVKVAIKTLGKLQAASAVSYLIGMINKPGLRIDSIRALGEIGNDEALKILLSELNTENDRSTRIAIINAIGRIGSRASVSRLFSLLKPDKNGKIDPDILKASLEALVNTADKGYQDRNLQETFKDYLTSADPKLRILAIKGLSNFNNPATSEKLFLLLKKENSENVRITLINALNKLNFSGTIPAFIGILRKDSTPDKERQAVINALGNNKSGDKALNFIIAALGSADKNVRETAAAALIKLYKTHSDSVVGALNRSLVRSKDKQTLTAGTAVLAQLGNEKSLPLLIPLLSSQYPEVKKNVTWALYRIHSRSNIRAVDELKKLVKSDTEYLSVRINAVRALGAIGLDSPQLKVWETLLDVIKLRSDKFTALRTFAVESLGELREANPAVINTLAKIAERDPNTEIKKTAVLAIRKIAVEDQDVENSLARVFKKNSDIELRIRVLEALGDMFSQRTAELSSDILKQELTASQKKRIIYALYQVGTKPELSLIIDMARDKALTDYIEALLSNSNTDILLPLINNRLRSESNNTIINMLESLSAEIEGSY